jgi:hypothetical protein
MRTSLSLLYLLTTESSMGCIAGAISGALLPTSITQTDAIANIWDIFESWCLLAPPSLQPICIMVPGPPRLPSSIAPRVAPNPNPSPAWSLPQLSASAPCSPAPLAFKATLRQLSFSTDKLPPPPPPVSPPAPLAHEPRSHQTRSWAAAPLALFCRGSADDPFGEWIANCVRATQLERAE